jgi:type II secretory pathway component PulF
MAFKVAGSMAFKEGFSKANPALLEPIMIVFLGVVVGGMIVAMYLPIFDMVNAVQ